MGTYTLCELHNDLLAPYIAATAPITVEVTADTANNHLHIQFLPSLEYNQALQAYVIPNYAKPVLKKHILVGEPAAIPTIPRWGDPHEVSPLTQPVTYRIELPLGDVSQIHHMTCTSRSPTPSRFR